MALKYADGFEQFVDGAISTNTYLTSQSSSNVHYSWSGIYAGSRVVPTTTAYRTAQNTNSASLRIDTLSAVFMGIPTNETVIIGFGLRMNQLFSKDKATFLFFGDTPHYVSSAKGLHFFVNLDASISIYNEATNVEIARTQPGILSLYTWSYIELKVSFSASSGSYELRIEGDTVLSGTGVDTLCGFTSVTGFNLCSYRNNYGEYFYIDDFYICDTQGSVNNDFLGPLSVYTLFADGDGSATNFTPTGAANNYLAINNLQSSTSTNSYVESGVTGEKDLYTLSNLPANVTSGTVVAVMVRSYINKLDSGTRTTQLLVKNAVGEKNSSSLSATALTWVNAYAVFEKQPDDSTAWDVAAVNALEVGHKNST